MSDNFLPRFLAACAEHIATVHDLIGQHISFAAVLFTCWVFAGWVTLDETWLVGGSLKHIQ